MKIFLLISIVAAVTHIRYGRETIINSKNNMHKSLDTSGYYRIQCRDGKSRACYFNFTDLSISGCEYNKYVKTSVSERSFNLKCFDGEEFQYDWLPKGILKTSYKSKGSDDFSVTFLKSKFLFKIYRFSKTHVGFYKGDELLFDLVGSNEFGFTEVFDIKPEKGVSTKKKVLGIGKVKITKSKVSFRMNYDQFNAQFMFENNYLNIKVYNEQGIGGQYNLEFDDTYETKLLYPENLKEFDNESNLEKHETENRKNAADCPVDPYDRLPTGSRIYNYAF